MAKSKSLTNQEEIKEKNRDSLLTYEYEQNAGPVDMET